MLAERVAEEEPFTNVEADAEVGEAEVEGEAPVRKVEPEPMLLGGAGALRCGTRFMSAKSKLLPRPVKAPSVLPMPSTPLR